MSHLDSEINSMRLRLAALEEQQQFEAEIALEKKAFPLQTLEGIIHEKKKQIERNSYSKSVPLARFYDEEKVAFLEPILNMLKSIQERLDILDLEPIYNTLNSLEKRLDILEEK